MNLTAKNPNEQAVLDYLEANASPELKAKIDAEGKTLAGCWAYITSFAKSKIALKDRHGEKCVHLSPEEVYGGASHPAVGEMAMSRLFLEYMTAAADELIASGKRGATLLVGVPQGAVSKAAGQHRRNTMALTERYAPYGIKHVKYSEDRSLAGYRITADII